jgi:hypothetical protein
MGNRFMNIFAIWIFSASVGSVCVLAAAGGAEAGMAGAVTQRGDAVQIDILQHGRISVLTSGDTRTVGEDSEGGEVSRGEGAELTFQPTNIVPLEPGEGFGFRIEIPPIAAGDSLAVDVVVTLPSISIDMTVARSEIRGRLVYDKTHAGEHRNVTWMFSEDNSRYHKTGHWTLSLYNNGKLLVSRPFQVVSSQPPVK